MYAITKYFSQPWSFLFLLAVLPSNPAVAVEPKVLDTGLQLVLNDAVSFIKTTEAKQSELDSKDALCSTYGKRTAYVGRIRIGNKHGGTDADENGLTINLCIPVELPHEMSRNLDKLGINPLAERGIFIPRVQKESRLHVICPRDNFIINHLHSGDENGNTTYICAAFTINSWPLQWTPNGGSATRKQSDVGAFTCIDTKGLLMKGVEHHGDENGNTTFDCTVPIIMAPYTGDHGLLSGNIDQYEALTEIFGASSYREFFVSILKSSSVNEALIHMLEIKESDEIQGLPALLSNRLIEDLEAVFGASNQRVLFQKYLEVQTLDDLESAIDTLEGLKENWLDETKPALDRAVEALGLASVNSLLHKTYEHPVLGTFTSLVTTYTDETVQGVVDDILNNDFSSDCGSNEGLPPLLQERLDSLCSGITPISG